MDNINIELNSLILPNLIKNKRVVICGPASYLNKYRKGKLIDKYDVVVRINKGDKLTERYKIFGKRTDILYHCLSENEEDGGIINDKTIEKIKLIVGAFPLLKENENTSFKNGNEKKFNNFCRKYPEKLTIINKMFYLNLEKNIGCRPNTGIITILDILRYKPKKLYITGFTFFKDGYSKYYRNIINGKKVDEKSSNKEVIKKMTGVKYKGRHNQYLIFKYIKNIIKNNKIIKIDKQLKKIFSFDLEKYKNNLNLYNYTNEEVFNHYLIN